MMNIACSTCLESFTSGCDISTTPCGHVFHTSCITRWLNRNNDCSQCRKDCNFRQIIKLYFSESQFALEEQITINDLEQKCLKLEEKSQICDREVSTMKKIVDNCALERNQTNQKCKKLEHEKLLMKLDWSKTEWNLKESINKANKQIKDLKKECFPLAIDSGKLEVFDINLECDFNCTGMELYNALTQPEMIQVFTKNPVKMAGDAKPGVEFTIYDGSINGTFISLTPYTKISQFWRLKSWPTGHFSEVVMKITQTKDNTKLHLTQKGVPTKELEPTKMGWHRYYFHAINQAFGFGSSLFWDPK